MISRNVRIQKAYIFHKIVAFLFDVLSYILLILVLYFSTLYLIFEPTLKYSDAKSSSYEIRETYGLNLGDNKTYEEYEEVLQDFYFNKYSEEIISQKEKLYNEKFSITHIYNFSVLGLIEHPNLNNFKTTLFSYQQNEDGSFNPDLMAIKLPGSGKRYEKDMKDLYYGAYKKLDNYLYLFNEDYAHYQNIITNSETYSRMVASIISFIILSLLIPFIFKGRASLGERIFKLGHANLKNGYLANNIKTIFRSFILYLIPLLGFIFYSYNSIIIITTGYLFLNLLVIILSKNNMDLADFLLKTETISIQESLLFKDKNAEEEYLKKLVETDEDNYIAKLSKITPIDINTSPDEKIKEKIKKGKNKNDL